MKRVLLLSVLVVLGVIASLAVSRETPKTEPNRLQTGGHRYWIDEGKALEKINRAWEVSWERFYHPKTSQFYDYLISSTKGSN